MKVGSGNPPTNIDPRLLPQNQAIGEATKGEDPGKDAAKVTLSPSATAMKMVQDEFSSLPDVRMQKVEEIRKEIDTGTYARPADQVASKMIVQSLIDSLYQK